MNELALFAGAGGGLLGTRLLGFKPVCAVELDPYRREILLRRQEEGFLEPFPVWADVRTFDGHPWRGAVDIVTAGFPCQPFSVAGKRKGETDSRNMWPDTIRVIREVRPSFCLLENVPGLKAKPYFETILNDLASSGYDIRWDCVRASDCGADHIRSRLWILAYTESGLLRLQQRRRSGESGQDSLRAQHCSWWAGEPPMARMAHGLANRLVQAEAIGDGQVPAVVVRAWEILTNDCNRH